MCRPRAPSRRAGSPREGASHLTRRPASAAREVPEARGAGRREHGGAGRANGVVVVVADPVLIAGGRAGGLDPSQEARLDEGPEAVEDRLMRDRPEGGPDAGLDLLGGGVRARGDRFEDRHPLGGDLQAVGPEAGGRVKGWTGVVRHVRGVVRQILDWVKNRVVG